MNKIKLLFLCTGNSCRSQMAEGLLRNLRGEEFEVFSAGIETHGINQNAVKVMKEIGIDISLQKSQNISEFENVNLDCVITVCDNALQTCPVFPNKCKTFHISFKDTPALANKIAKDSGSIEAQLNCYRKVRDEIKEYIINNL